MFDLFPYLKQTLENTEGWNVFIAGFAVVAVFLLRGWSRRKYFLQDRRANLLLSDSAQLAILRVESVRLYDRAIDAEQTARAAIAFISEDPDLAKAMLQQFISKDPLPDPSRLLPPPLQPPLMVFGHDDDGETSGWLEIIKTIFSK